MGLCSGNIPLLMWLWSSHLCWLLQVLKPKSFLWEGLCYSFIGEADESMCQCGCNPLVDRSQSLVLWWTGPEALPGNNPSPPAKGADGLDLKNL